MSKLLRIAHIYLTKILFVVGLAYVYLTHPNDSCCSKEKKESTPMVNQNSTEQIKTRKTPSMTDEDKMAEENQPNNNNAHDSQMASQATENQGS